MAVVEMRNLHRTAEAAAKVVIAEGRLAGEAVNVRIQSVILHVFEQAAMIGVGTGLGGEGDVANLGELGAVVEVGDLDLGDIFRRRIRVLQGAVVEDVGGRDTVHRVAHHVGGGSAQGDVARAIGLHIGQQAEARQRAGGGSARVDGQLLDRGVVLRVVQRALVGGDHGRGGRDIDRLLRPVRRSSPR